MNATSQAYMDKFTVSGVLPEFESFKLELEVHSAAPIDAAVRKVLDLYCATGIRAERTRLKNKAVGLALSFELGTLEGAVEELRSIFNIKKGCPVAEKFVPAIDALLEKEYVLDQFDSLDAMQLSNDSNAVANFMETGMSSWEVAQWLRNEGKQAMTGGATTTDTAIACYHVAYVIEKWGSELDAVAA